jgi:hypothetical protein
MLPSHWQQDTFMPFVAISQYIQFRPQTPFYSIPSNSKSTIAVAMSTDIDYSTIPYEKAPSRDIEDDGDSSDTEFLVSSKSNQRLEHGRSFARILHWTVHCFSFIICLSLLIHARIESKNASRKCLRRYHAYCKVPITYLARPDYLKRYSTYTRRTR